MIRTRWMCGALAVAGILTVGFALKQADPLAPVTVSHSYHSSDFGSIEVLGVCNVEPDSVGCWDVDGKPDSVLTVKVTAYQLANPTSNLYFKFGYKNRLVVLRATTNVPSDFFFASHSQISGGSYPTEVGALRGGGQGGQGGAMGTAWVDASDTNPSKPAEATPSDTSYIVYADPSQATETIDFPIRVSFGKVNIPLKVGAEGQLGPMRVHIDGINTMPDRPVVTHAKTRHRHAWSVSLSITGYPGSVLPPIQGTPLDSNGAAIGLAELSGEPVRAGSSRGTWYEGWNPTPTTPAELRVIAGSGTTHQVLGLAPNPSKVSSLTLTASGVREVTIGDIPLDPKD